MGTLSPAAPSPPRPRPSGARVTSDADLIRRCLVGDRVAWAELLSRYGDLVYGVLARESLDAAAAADAFQEVSVLLWKGLAKLRDVERLAPWLVVTSRRVAWRMRKRTKARRAREQASSRREAEGSVGPDTELSRIEEEQVVREALGALGERCRRLLTALYFEATNGSYDDVSARIGIPRGSIGPTRQRCLDSLRAELFARGIGPEVSTPSPAASSGGTRSPRPKKGGGR